MTRKQMEAIQKKHAPLPVPDEVDNRICFGIAYFKKEADADRYAAYVRDRGITYNGGWMDGKPCGRDNTWDYVKDGVKLYAVTE